MIGTNVKNHLGESVGKVKDILIDMEKECIAYALLSTAGLPAADGKLLAVPWRALTLKPEEKVFVLRLEKEKLKSAPTLEAAHVAEELANRDRCEQIHTYYGVDPYWEH